VDVYSFILVLYTHGQWNLLSTVILAWYVAQFSVLTV